MGLFSLEKLFGITIRESATDGSDFTNPDADYRRLFLGEDGQLHVKDSAGAVTDIGAGSGAPTTADYLVGTAQGGLSAEIVVGTSPGGELGGTWASPTVDATHSGSAHPTASSCVPSGNVSIPNTSTWTDICTISLAAGTYLGWGQARLGGVTANHWGLRLYDGTNELGGNELPTGNFGIDVFTLGAFTLGSTTTVKLQGVAVDALTVLKNRPDFTANACTYATFLKIA